MMNLSENDIAKKVVDAAFQIHTETGPGLLINFGDGLIKNGITRVVNGL